MSALLEVKGLTKRFGGLTAVKDVAFALQPGEITGILGPNGAGKTTLFNLLTGFIPTDTGSIVFDGQPIRGLKPFRIVNRGLARTFQLTRPFIGMTVLENVVVGCLAPRVRRVTWRLATVALSASETAITVREYASSAVSESELIAGRSSAGIVPLLLGIQ